MDCVPRGSPNARDSTVLSCGTQVLHAGGTQCPPLTAQAEGGLGRG